MTLITDGCIQYGTNAYFTRGTSAKLREYLGAIASEYFPKLYEMYELRRGQEEILGLYLIGAYSYRLVARHPDIFPKEIPLFPDEDGNVFFVIRKGDRP
ncbi:hypothetical protein CTV96_09690 [Bacillus altitudinis]|uniref:hypothetical protein n=1 Tax=Bacillus altitudinis TaxID=293387 RepID=UPI000C23EBE8|nr:hypothetical protein [Bacillus altitudinis]PJI12408.1 hypothetical protein CTV96_09690 [Bacillus altitudinis]PKQ85577.1 hypothetical protein CTV98_007405 [Bacillus altitudinis]